MSNAEEANVGHSAGTHCYAVELYVVVNEVGFKKRITLPFVPFVGLKIGPHTVEEVMWLMDENEFFVCCEDEEWDSTDAEVMLEMVERFWAEE